MTCFAFSDVVFLLLWSRQKLLEIFLHIEMYKSQPNAAIYIYILLVVVLQLYSTLY